MKFFSKYSFDFHPYFILSVDWLIFTATFLKYKLILRSLTQS